MPIIDELWLNHVYGADLKIFSLSKLAFSLPMAILAAFLLIFINETTYRDSAAAVASIEEAQKTRTELNRLLQQILDAETGQRGFLLTGDVRYLEPYTLATETIGQNLDQLRQIFVYDKQELDIFSQLSRNVSRKLAEMDLSVRMRRQGNEDAWRFVLGTDVGKEHMNAIRDYTDRLSVRSLQKIEKGQSQVQRSMLLTRFGVGAMALISLFALYLYLRQNKRLLESGQREQESLQRERDLLEGQVRDRTANLAELATHLQNVREDERGHLARELHDELGALLTAAKLDVARLKARLMPTMPDAVDRLQHLTNTLNNGIALKRRIVEDLRPSSLSHLGLIPSLEILSREFAERSGLSIATDLESVELNGSSQLTVYRLVQESLTNIGKYAQASQIDISLHNFENYITVDVKDNGQGFKVENVSMTSHGLSGMRHRVEAAGGKLTVMSQPQEGTRISAVLPKSA